MILQLAFLLWAKVEAGEERKGLLATLGEGSPEALQLLPAAEFLLLVSNRFFDGCHGTPSAEHQRLPGKLVSDSQEGLSLALVGSRTQLQLCEPRSDPAHLSLPTCTDGPEFKAQHIPSKG